MSVGSIFSTRTEIKNGNTLLILAPVFEETASQRDGFSSRGLKLLIQKVSQLQFEIFDQGERLGTYDLNPICKIEVVAIGGPGNDGCPGWPGRDGANGYGGSSASRNCPATNGGNGEDGGPGGPGQDGGNGGNGGIVAIHCSSKDADLLNLFEFCVFGGPGGRGGPGGPGGKGGHEGPGGCGNSWTELRTDSWGIPNGSRAFSMPAGSCGSPGRDGPWGPHGIDGERGQDGEYGFVVDGVLHRNGYDPVRMYSPPPSASQENVLTQRHRGGTSSGASVENSPPMPPLSEICKKVGSVSFNIFFQTLGCGPDFLGEVTSAIDLIRQNRSASERSSENRFFTFPPSDACKKVTKVCLGFFFASIVVSGYLSR